jgi:glycosyltransferase involved in cell wall biosynthesis
MHLAVVTPQPTPYRDPFWNTVAAQPGVELDVYYCYAKSEDRPWDVDWPWRFRGEVLPGRALLGNHNGYWNPAILNRLRACKYDAIILGGYNHFTMLAAAWYARRQGIPYLLMCESFHGLTRPWYSRVLKGPLVRWIVRGAAGILPTGRLAKEYLLFYGGREEYCCFVPNVPDVIAFHHQAKELEEQRQALKRALGLAAEKVILFVGRLIWKKGVDILVDALKGLRGRWSLEVVIAGDGPERVRLEKHVQAAGLAENVKFIGFQQPRDLPRWYSVADLFVLPSRTEPWGVVVLEALASGVPVVVTDKVGCFPDVVNDPRVGSVVPAEDPEALGRAIENFLGDLPSRGEIHERWEPVRKKMSYAAIAEGLLALLRRIESNGDLCERR